MDALRSTDEIPSTAAAAAAEEEEEEEEDRRTTVANARSSPATIC